MATLERQLPRRRDRPSPAQILARVVERPEAVLAACIVIAMALNLWETRGQTFFSDEWSRYLYADKSVEDLLRGHSGHLVVLNTVVYKALLYAFGAHSYAPFRLVEAVLLGACGALFYLLARGRAGPWASVAATVVILFLGSAVEVTATPYGIVILLPVSLGLGALVALDRFKRDADLLTCLLLVGSVAAHSDGLAFLAGATVMLALQSGRRFVGRLWVVGVPALLYAAWTAWYHLTATQMTQEVVHLRNLSQVPSTIASVSAAGLSAASGLFGTTETGQFNIEAGYLLLGLLIAAGVWRLRRGPPVAREVWIPLALGLTFWALLGMVASPHRPPTASRYLYPTVAFLLLIVLELASGLRTTPRLVWITIGALVVSLVPNLINLNTQAGKIRDAAARERAELGAVELLRDEVPLASIPDLVRHARLISAGGQGFHFPVTTYFNAIVRYGSPAARPQALPSLGEEERLAVDRVLLRGHDLRLTDAPARSGGASDCRPAFGPSAPSGATFTVPASGLLIRPRSSRSNVTVAARRFAAGFQPLAVPGGSGPLELEPGAAQAVRPWIARVTGATVCTAG